MPDGSTDSDRRQHFIGETCLSDTTGHAPHDTAGFVLNDHSPSGIDDGLTAGESIDSHARQDDTQHAIGEDIGCGPEQDVGRRSTRVFRIRLVELQPNSM